MNERWVVPPLDSPGSTALASAFRASGQDLPKTVLTTYSVSLRIALASTGQFVTALPTSVLRLNSKFLPLKEVAVSLRMPPWPVAAVTPKDRTLNPAVAPFLECARLIAKAAATGP